MPDPLYAVGLISMELARADGRPLGETLKTATKSILANTLMIGVIAGVTINLSGLTLPGPVIATST